MTHFLKFTSGATPANLLVASMAAELISPTYLRADIGGAWNWDHSCCRERLYRLISHHVKPIGPVGLHRLFRTNFEIWGNSIHQKFWLFGQIHQMSELDQIRSVPLRWQSPWFYIMHATKKQNKSFWTINILPPQQQSCIRLSIMMTWYFPFYPGQLQKW